MQSSCLYGQAKKFGAAFAAVCKLTNCSGNNIFLNNFIGQSKKKCAAMLNFIKVKNHL